MAENSRMQTAKRYRRGRDDASIESISNQIEKMFDLPKGCVVITKMNGRKMRSDALLRSLRNDWGTNE